MNRCHRMIPITRSLHPHLRWWLQEDTVLQGQPLHHSVMLCNLYTCIKRRVGRSLRGVRCKGNLVPSMKQLHLNYLELKVVCLRIYRILTLLVRDSLISQSLCTSVWHWLHTALTHQVHLRIWTLVYRGGWHGLHICI